MSAINIRMLIRSFSICLFVVLIAGCATRPNLTVIPPNKTLFDEPSVGQIAQAELGDTMLSKGEVYETRAIRTLTPVSNGSDGVWILRLTAPKGVHPLKYQDREWEYFSGKPIEVFDAIAGAKPHYGGLRVNKAIPSKVEVYMEGAGIASFEPSSPVQFEFTTARAVDQPSFVQELIYNGRVGDNLRFIYREFSNDMARPAFSQEAFYDLSEGKVLGFKGVRIEILEATNTNVRYKVLKTFPDPPSN